MAARLDPSRLPAPGAPLACPRPAASASDEVSRLDAAMRRADDVLVQSLQREEERRRRRRRALVLIGGGILMLALISVTLALLLPGAGPKSAGTALPVAEPAAPPSTATAAATAAPAAAPAKEKLPTFGPCEVKWGGLWRKVTIMRQESGWLVVKYEHLENPMAFEWVEPWRVRAVGSARELPYCRPNPPGKRPGPNPGPAPDDAKPDKPDAAAADAPAAAEAAEAALTPVNVAAARAVKLDDAGAPAWAYQPDPAPATPVAPPGPVALTGGTGQFFEAVEGLAFAGPGRAVAYVTHVDAPPGKPAQVHVERVDLKAGKSAGVVDFNGLKPLCVSPDGKLMLLGAARGRPGEHTRVELWALDPTPQRQAAFAPHGKEDWAHCDIEWAAFPTADHLLTLSNGHKLVLWKLPQLEAVYQVDLGGGEPALSPGGRYLAVATGTQVWLLDVVRGAPAGRLAVAAPWAKVAFRADGRQLAVASGGRLRVWDLVANALAHDVFLPPKVAAQAVDFPADGLVLMNGQLLVDLPRGVVLWRYAGGASGRGADIGDAAAGRLWQVVGGQRGVRNGSATLVSLPVPSAEVSQAAAALKPAEVFAAQAGAKVTLEVSFAEGDSAAVTAALTEKLKARQFTVAPDQPVRLVATLTTGKTRDIEYHMFGHPGNTKASITERLVSLQFKVNNLPAWEATAVYSGPGFISLKQGQTLEQYLADYQANAWKFFTTVELPATVPHPRDPLGWGATDLTK